MATLFATLAAKLAAPIVAGSSVTVGSALSTGLQVAGTAIAAGGAIQAGNAQQAAAAYEAQQLEQRGKSEFAAASRRAAEEQRRARILASRARAVGAAGGGGVDYELLGDIEEEGYLRATTRIWEGEEALRGNFDAASARRFSGDQRAKAGRIRAGTTILGGGTSLLEKYG